MPMISNTDIDALSGRELDAAVAVARGWRWMQPRTTEGIALYHPDEIDDYDLIEPRTTARIEGWDEGVPSYSADIDLAWQLEGIGYVFSFRESHYIGGDVMCSLAVTGKGIIVHSVVFMGENKAAAYAVARCRAWLKAKYAERLCEHGFTISCPEGCN
jgi:hypothetical protein